MENKFWNRKNKFTTLLLASSFIIFGLFYIYDFFNYHEFNIKVRQTIKTKEQKLVYTDRGLFEIKEYWWNFNNSKTELFKSLKVDKCYQINTQGGGIFNQVNIYSAIEIKCINK